MAQDTFERPTTPTADEEFAGWMVILFGVFVVATVTIAYLAFFALILGVNGGFSCSQVQQIYFVIGIYLVLVVGVRALLLYGTRRGRTYRAGKLAKSGRFVDWMSAFYLGYAVIPFVVAAGTRC
jgi:hypothetical protein